MITARSHFAYATIGDYIYVFGGFLEGEGLSNCEKYSISNDS
jgi:hypothetical protein